MADKSYQLIVISDLHLSEGWNPETCRLYHHEDFFFDKSFARFLRFLSEKAKQGGCYNRLVINGDFVDFLQFFRTEVLDKSSIQGEEVTARERTYGLGTSAAKTIWKLDILLGGHPIFFDALRQFLLQGNEILIIAGNHDIEWIIPEVQEAFKEKLAQEIPEDRKADFKDRIQFHPWFYYDANLSVYLEHGSQYDGLNSFDYYLCPFREDGTIDLPAGSFFVRYLINRVEEDYPFADNMKPQMKFFFWALRQWKTWSSGRIFMYIELIPRILGKAGPVEESWKEKLEIRQQEELRRLAEGSGLDLDQVLKLKELWVPSALHHNDRWPLFKEFFQGSKVGNEYFRGKAKAIQEILGVRYVSLAHTHNADIALIGRPGTCKKSEYVNSGTWIKIFAETYEERLLKSENEFAYVNFSFEPAGDDVRMELLRWNDSIGEGERIRLFEE